MSDKLIKLFIACTILSAGLTAQYSRTDAMGGLSFSIIDKDHSLRPYRFGANPAGLFAEEKESILRMSGSAENTWGNYRRRYDSEGTSNASANFQEVKIIEEHGTFSGTTSYMYENRRNQYRSLLRDTYAGESFFLTDTTAADFRYMGPSVSLAYSWEPLDGLCIGGLIGYQLLDGLKKQFSYSKTVFRTAELQAGLTYALYENVIIGLSMKYLDLQESIEASDVNLLDVELHYFRGDNLYVSKRSGTMTGKIEKHRLSFGSQLFWEVANKTTLGVQINYAPANSRLLKPYSSSVQTFDEVEDSYSSFEFSDVRAALQHSCSDDILIGVTAMYCLENSWSKISSKDLLIWKWDVKRLAFGAGGSYQLSPSLVVGCEYEISSIVADSSKYIDNRTVNTTSFDHALRMGTEFKMNNDFVLRAGGTYGYKAHDLIRGGDQCTVTGIMGGFGFPVSSQIWIDAGIVYQQLSPVSPANSARTNLSGNISIELRAF